MLNVVSPSVPGGDVDLIALQSEIEIIADYLQQISNYLALIFSLLLLIFIFIVGISLYRLFYRTFFVRNDFLN